jgi:hypothetical protein
MVILESKYGGMNVSVGWRSLTRGEREYTAAGQSKRLFKAVAAWFAGGGDVTLGVADMETVDAPWFPLLFAIIDFAANLSASFLTSFS